MTTTAINCHWLIELIFWANNGSLEEGPSRGMQMITYEDFNVIKIRSLNLSSRGITYRLESRHWSIGFVP